MAGKKPTVYLDANIFSAMFTPPYDAVLIERRLRTEEWWEFERTQFRLCSSNRAEFELSSGIFRAQDPALAALRRLPYLHADIRVHKLIATYMEHNIIPRTEPADSFHLAISTVNRIDYLLSWNHTHLLNPVTRLKLDKLDQKLNLRSPLIVSPETIPWVSFGQEIRRRDD